MFENAYDPNPQGNHTINLCPCLTFVSGVARSYINDVARARDARSRDEAIAKCLLIGKLILNVCEPLADRAGGPDYADAYNRVATGLLRLAGYTGASAEFHAENFPADDGRQLLTDRLDEIHALLRSINSTAKAIAADVRGERSVAA